VSQYACATNRRSAIHYRDESTVSSPYISCFYVIETQNQRNNGYSEKDSAHHSTRKYYNLPPTRISHGFIVHLRLSVKCCDDVYVFWIAVVLILDCEVPLQRECTLKRVFHYKILSVFARFMFMFQLTNCLQCRIMSHTLTITVR